MKFYIIAFFLCVATSIPVKVKATPQVQDVVILNGECLALYYQFPLEVYLWSDANPGDEEPFNFGVKGSHCTRGYSATYEIRESQLFLIKIEKRMPVKEPWWRRWKRDQNSFLTMEWREMPLSIIFPEEKGSIFAEWYSDTLIIPHGNMIEPSQKRERELFEHEIHMVVEHGVVKNIKSVVHATPINSEESDKN